MLLCFKSLIKSDTGLNLYSVYKLDKRENIETISTKIDLMIYNQQDTTLDIQESKETLKSTRDTVRPYMDFIQEERHTKMLEKETIKKRWSDMLDKHKWSYYNMTRSNGVVEHYRTFLARDVPFLPAKFRPRKIPGETEDETRIKKEFTKTKLRTEIVILTLRAEKYETEVRTQIVKRKVHKLGLRSQAMQMEMERRTRGGIRKITMGITKVTKQYSVGVSRGTSRGTSQDVDLGE